MPTIEDAIALATEAHRGQTRPDGTAFILHPLRVMLSLRDEVDQVAAALHDVVEDTAITLDDLGERGYDAEVVEAVDRLTRREGESYEAFVERVAPHARATADQAGRPGRRHGRAAADGVRGQGWGEDGAVSSGLAAVDGSDGAAIQ